MTKNTDTITRPANPANPACGVCDGTGTDPLFNSDCSECWIDADRHEGVRTTNADRAFTPGERLDGRTFGASASTAPTDKQVRFLNRLIDERSGTPEAETARAALDTGKLDKRSVSKIIDALKSVRPTAAASGPAASVKQVRFIENLIAERDSEHPAVALATQRLAEGLSVGKASEIIDYLLNNVEVVERTTERRPVVEGLDLSPLEAYTSNGLVRMAIPGTTNDSTGSRLKVRVKFARNGSIYVDDAAEYGEGRNYGSQRPSGSYRGDIADELRSMLDDPHGAVVAYAAITSRCGVCNAKLEDKASVERGMGPVCAAKF